MRERWLFLLLCAFMVQLSRAEYAVGINGSRLDTIQADPTTSYVFYGDLPVNGSDFTSGMEKIRRVRSIEDELKEAQDALKEAEKKHEQSDLEKTNARNLDDRAAKDLKDKTEAYDKAFEELKNIEADFKEAERIKKEADEKFELESNYLTKNETAYETAKLNYTETEKQKNELEKKKDAKKEDFEKKEEAAKKAKEALTDHARDVLDETEKLIEAENDLSKMQKKMLEKQAELKAHEAKFDENDAKIKLFQKYEKLVAERDSEITKKAQFTNQQAPITTAKNDLVTKKDKMEKNKVFQGEGMTNQWNQMTVDMAITEWTQKEENLTQEITEMEKANKTENLLQKKVDVTNVREKKEKIIEIKSFGFKEQKLQIIVDSHAQLTAEVQAKIDEANKKINEITAQINKIEPVIVAKDKNIATLLEASKKTVDVIKSDNRNAVKKVTNLSNKVKDAKSDISDLDGKITDQTTATAKIKENSSTMNATLISLKDISKKADLEETYARGNSTEAEEAFTTYADKEFKNAKKLKEDADSAKKTASERKVAAAQVQAKAVGTMKTKTDEKDEKTTEVKNKKKEKEEAGIIKKHTGETATAALIDHDNKGQDVKKLKLVADQKLHEKQASDEKKIAEQKAAEEKKKTIAALSTGLGTSIGILVLMVIGGVIVFVMIKRKKKAAKEKKPKREEIKAPDGRTIIRREGMPDKYIIKSEDIQDMGVLKPGPHIHGIPALGKHKFDGQEDGDLIKDVKFDNTQNRVYHVGKGLDILPEKDDSVDASEAYGTEDIKQMGEYVMRETDGAAPNSARYREEELPNEKKSSNPKRAKESSSNTAPSSGDEPGKKH